MPPTDAATRPALRDRALGKVLALLAVLVLAFVAARSCASSGGDVSKEEAVEIARERVEFQFDDFQIRNVPQGFPQRRVWAVSFYDGPPTAPTRITLVEVDARTGDVLGVKRSGP